MIRPIKALRGLRAGQQPYRPADAVRSSAMLERVPPPAEIADAIAAAQSPARRLVGVRECVVLQKPSTYLFVHDCDALFSGRTGIHRPVIDEAPQARVVLSAWAAPAAA